MKNELEEVEVRTMSKLIVYSDGASRGNPGPSAAAFVALTEELALIGSCT
jgi:ribonuclease HI